MKEVKVVTLANGLKIVLAPCEAESVAFGLFVASGSRHEPARLAGISHFIEHMLFKGTPTRRPVDITRAIEGRGGNFNACTGEEMTCFYAHLPDEHLKDAVEILYDMYLNASIPEDEFIREKEVVMEEIRMYADDPESVALENLQSAIFPGHPLGRPVAGKVETLRPMTTDDLRRYMRSHYRPKRTIAVLVGAFAEEKALALIRRRGEVNSPLSARRSPLSTHHFPLSTPVPLVTAKRDIAQAQLALGYRTFGFADARKYAATVLDAILGRGMSSRLFIEARERRGLTYDISSRLQLFEDAGMFTVTAGVEPSRRERLLAVIDRELRRICEKPVAAAELKRTKEFLVGNFRLSQEKLTSKLFFLGQTMLSFGRLVTSQEQVAAIRAVTPEEVQAVARAIFRPELRTISWVLPSCAKNEGSVPTFPVGTDPSFSFPSPHPLDIEKQN